MKYLSTFESFSMTKTDNKELVNAANSLNYINFIDKLKEYIKYNNFDDFRKRVDFVLNDPYIFKGLKIDNDNYIDPPSISKSEFKSKILAWSIEFIAEDFINYLIETHDYTKDEIEDSIESATIIIAKEGFPKSDIKKFIEIIKDKTNISISLDWEGIYNEFKS